MASSSEPGHCRSGGDSLLAFTFGNMTILRVGTNEKYSNNWDDIFGGAKKKSTKKKTTKKAAKKKATKKVAAKKTTKKAAKKKSLLLMR